MNVKIKWHTDEEKPKEGKTVWIIERHPKGIYPMSYAIHAGVVEYSKIDNRWRVAQCDEAGAGCVSWEPEIHSSGCSDYCAWAYADENKILPEWV